MAGSMKARKIGAEESPPKPAPVTLPAAVAEPYGGGEVRGGADEPGVGAEVGGAGLAEYRVAVDVGACTRSSLDCLSQQVLGAGGDVVAEPALVGWCGPVEEYLALSVEDFRDHVRPVVHAVIGQCADDGGHLEWCCLDGADREIEEALQWLGDADLVGHRDDFVLADAGRQPHESAIH